MSALTRIAPTPSGFLHMGNMCSFVLTWALARGMGGKVLLRIDDLDAERVRQEYVEDIFRAIDLLGIDYDMGPSGVDDFNKNWSQHLRRSHYEDVLNKLLATDRVFACKLSRKALRDYAQDGHYLLSGCSQNFPLDNGDVSLRVITPDEIISWQDRDGTARNVNLYHTMRDFVVRRRDGVPAYQLASLADDLFFGVNLIVRGEDLLPSTAAQRYLASLIEEEKFTASAFFHHPLITNQMGEKLSKSAGSRVQAKRLEKVDKAFIFDRVKIWLCDAACSGSAREVLEQWRLH
jgi:glutamyl/glutaminyl-tRNA synthetase